MSFKRLDPEDFLVSADSITATAWSTNSPTLTEFYTSSVQASSTSGKFYLDVYQTGSNLTGAAVQFAIAYGNKYGYGAPYYNDLVAGKTPTRTVFGQFRNLIYGDENAEFIYTPATASDFWALSVERARYKEHLFKGSFNLKLTTAGGDLYLTDNSKDTSTDSFLDAGRVYQIVSGSNGKAYSGTGYSATSGSYGLFLPDVGLAVLNPLALDETIALAPSKSVDAQDANNKILFNAIKAGGSFKLNSEETVTSDYVYVRARNAEFNYSDNPSFISGSTGEVLFDQFIYAPQTYVTTIGLYNDSNELLAVAKLSKPLLKDFTKEALVRVKLDF